MKVKNILGKPFKISGKIIQPDEVREVEETQEIKNLIKQKYLEKVK